MTQQRSGFNEHVLVFEFRAIINRKLCTQEKVKSKKKINMADVYTGERDNVNFKTLFKIQYTSYIQTKNMHLSIFQSL